MKWIFSFLLLIMSAGPVVAGDVNPESPLFPPLIELLRAVDKPVFCAEAVPLDNQEVRERFEKELLLMIWDRPQVILWLKRGGRYLPHIEEVLARNGLPDDLKYVAVVESALRSEASSSMGAVGFWQFIPATGRYYGLAIDSDIDQRRNIFASTEAAVKYFKKLHSLFGSWTMAAAAYNMGEDGLKNEIESQKVSEFYKLYLPQETQRYILKVVAAKLILSDPAAYGFNLDPPDLYAPVDFETVTVRCTEKTPLLLVAQATRSYFKEIKDLNPEIRGYFLPEGSHAIAVPRGAGAGFEQRYAELVRTWGEENSRLSYLVRSGDSINLIAERFGVSPHSLLEWNNLDPEKHIHPGDKLIIYR